MEITPTQYLSLPPAIQKKCFSQFERAKIAEAALSSSSPSPRESSESSHSKWHRFSRKHDREFIIPTPPPPVQSRRVSTTERRTSTTAKFSLRDLVPIRLPPVTLFPAPEGCEQEYTNDNDDDDEEEEEEEEKGLYESEYSSSEDEGPATPGDASPVDHYHDDGTTLHSFRTGSTTSYEGGTLRGSSDPLALEPLPEFEGDVSGQHGVFAKEQKRRELRAVSGFSAADCSAAIVSDLASQLFVNAGSVDSVFAASSLLVVVLSSPLLEVIPGNGTPATFVPSTPFPSVALLSHPAGVPPETVVLFPAPNDLPTSDPKGGAVETPTCAPSGTAALLLIGSTFSLSSPNSFHSSICSRSWVC
ncbi:hypothetical protein K470DRAFT_266508 [Piedraia hortae CBS 480.64]|uniref:Uncharacterized protein n=1 Tax=Piedraia hortae CBS 480.64 TaxID=1314780 RepID=A0A6A7BS05_9PEZI|nr:hypothetical protein K470DRAFT_266508 [Piedraia hortae CBS 480.64]